MLGSFCLFSGDATGSYLLLVFSGSGSFGRVKKAVFSWDLLYTTKTSHNLQINLYNFKAPTRPGFTSFLSNYYIKILWQMSIQIVEIVR
jgi:hypothetical protein